MNIAICKIPLPTFSSEQRLTPVGELKYGSETIQKIKQLIIMIIFLNY